MEKPVVVVIAYNRPSSLSRLLLSLKKANYDLAYPIPKIVISIDNSNSGAVREVAEQFIWYGEKEVIFHERNLGLKEHVLFCGDLTYRYKSVIILEDDLVVSPLFYDYSVKALSFFGNDPHVAGISLYSYMVDEFSLSNFYPVFDGFDNYFLQISSSWGQVWNSDQWSKFRKSYNSGELELNDDDFLPDDLFLWGKSSWKKHFIKYLSLKNLYFVYPRISYTTNTGEVGANFTTSLKYFHSPLAMGLQDINFVNLEGSKSVYDCFFEIKINKMITVLNDISVGEIEVDLFGKKKLSKITSTFLLSPKNCKRPIFQFSSELLPNVNNILLNIKGDFYSLGLTSDFIENEPDDTEKVVKSNFKFVPFSILNLYRVEIENGYKNSTSYRIGNRLVKVVTHFKNLFQRN